LWSWGQTAVATLPVRTSRPPMRTGISISSDIISSRRFFRDFFSADPGE
jgi:hypothetical protein